MPALTGGGELAVPQLAQRQPRGVVSASKKSTKSKIRTQLMTTHQHSLVEEDDGVEKFWQDREEENQVQSLTGGGKLAVPQLAQRQPLGVDGRHSLGVSEVSDGQEDQAALAVLDGAVVELAQVL